MDIHHESGVAVATVDLTSGTHRVAGRAASAAAAPVAITTRNRRAAAAVASVNRGIT